MSGESAPLRAQCPDGTPPPCAGAAALVRPSPNSIAVDPRIQALRAESERILARARWR